MVGRDVARDRDGATGCDIADGGKEEMLGEVGAFLGFRRGAVLRFSEVDGRKKRKQGRGRRKEEGRRMYRWATLMFL
jgi:hypothetical protein